MKKIIAATALVAAPLSAGSAMAQEANFNELLGSLTGSVDPAPSPDCRPVEGNVYNAFTVCGDDVLRWSDRPTEPDLAPLADCRPAEANWSYSAGSGYLVCNADVPPSAPPCAIGYFGPSCRLVLRWPDRLKPAHERASPAERALQALAPVEPSPLSN